MLEILWIIIKAIFAGVMAGGPIYESGGDLPEGAYDFYPYDPAGW